MTNNPWKTISSKVIYKNPWITLREDQVINPAGKPGIYGVVEPRIATGIIPLEEDGSTYLVGQYRYPTNNYSWEMVEGGAELSEDPKKAVERELQEEAGIIAKEVIQLGGEVHLSNCFSSERAFFYVAKGLTHVSKAPEETEELALKKVHFTELERMVRDGEIVDAMTIIGVMRVRQWLLERGL